jgi:hypothetical protein
MPAQFGSLDDTLARTAAGRNLLSSAGPVSDAFILSTEPFPVINGPIGSAKTTAAVKKVIVEATRLPPWDTSDGEPRRTYIPFVFRLKYEQLWKGTIPSWWKIFPQDLGRWVGAPPRPAQHIIDWRDQWGPVRVIARFQAFGDTADPDDLRGLEGTDALLEEIDTMPEALAIAISGRIAREPGRQILRRPGRIYGTLNAPDVLNWTYRDFWEDPKPGYRLYRQPGGLDPAAENQAGTGRAYYEDIIAKNTHRAWYIRRMVHNRPGFTRDNDVVYPVYDDERHLAAKTIPFLPSLPVLVGIDGGLTPAAAYFQERPDGQVRQLAEVTITHGGMKALARAMLALEAWRFPGAEFVTAADPAMTAGEDTEEGSARAQLQKALHRQVKLARTNDPEQRNAPLRDKMQFTCETGEPGFLLDPSCKVSRRGYSQTYAYHRIRGTNERSRIIKNEDSHVMDAGGYAALETGQGHSRLLKAQRDKERRDRQAQNRKAGRYNPLARSP